MSFPINETGTIGQVIIGLNGITGNLFLSLLMILILLLVIALALHIPLEAIAIIFFPFLVVLVSFTGDFKAIFGVFIIYMAILLAKNLLRNNNP